MVKTKHTYWKKYRKGGEDYKNYGRLYKKISNEIRLTTRKARKKYEHSLAKSLKSKSSKPIYQYIKSKMSLKKAVTGLYRNGEETRESLCEDQREIAEILNTYFSSVYNEKPTSCKNVCENVCKNIDSDVTMPAVEISYWDVVYLLQNLNPNKATGPDQISAKILHELPEEFATPLLVIFKLSLKLGKIPKQWKEANVTPIFKSGSKRLAKNYRPVSLTSIICKILEKTY